MINSSQLHHLFQSDNLTDLAQKARKLLSNPLIITDLNHRVLGMSDEPDLADQKWLHIKESGIIDITPNIANIYHRSQLLQKPLVNKALSDSTDVMRMAVAHKEQLIGYLEIPCFNCIPSQEEQDLIIFIADIACLIMKRNLGYFNAPSDAIFFLISDLIEGRMSDERTCRARCDSLKWSIPEHYRVLTLSPNNAASADKPIPLKILKNNLTKAIPNTTAFIYGDSIKAIISVNEDSALDGRLFADLMDFLKSSLLEAGISKSTSLLSDMKSCNLASEKALYFGQLLKSDELLFFYDKYAVYHMLECCDTAADVMQFCHSAVIKLAEYDRTHQTDYLVTLRTFLYTGQNIADSAALLYIHRNTLTNRLQKIDDLIHVELQDSESFFHLMLSFHILEYIGSSRIFDYDNRIAANPQLKHQ